MTIEEMEKQLKSFQSDLETTKKDFQIKLDASNKTAEEWKTVAFKKEEEMKQYKEQAEKAEKDKEKAFAENLKRENKLFLENLKKEGRITPALQVLAEKLMESMTSKETIATFEEKDGKKIDHTQLSLFKQMLSSMKKAPIYSSMSRTEDQKPEIPDADGETHFMEVSIGGKKQSLPVDGMELHNEALKYQDEQRAKGKTISYETALIEAEKLMRVAA